MLAPTEFADAGVAPAGVVVDPPAGGGAACPVSLRHDGKPHALRGLRDSQLQICAGLQRHFRQHLERKPGDQDAREIFAHGQHARIDHRARLQHELRGRL